RPRRLPRESPARGHGASVPRHAAEGCTRPCAADVAGPAPALRAADRARSALQARGAGLHPRRLGVARRDDPALHPRPARGRDPRRPGRDPRPRQAALPRAGGRVEGALRDGDARGGVLRRDRPGLRGRGRRRRRTGGVRMRGEAAGALRHEFIGLYGMVERNWYLIKRYAWWEIAFFFWTAANTLTIVFIAKGVVAEGGSVNIDRLTTILLIGAVIWSYLGIVFELLIETV